MDRFDVLAWMGVGLVAALVSYLLATRQVGVLAQQLAVVTTEKAAQGEALRATIERETYWRSKAELLLDQTLFRRGEVTTPVFSASPQPATAAAPTLAGLFSAMAVTEVESGTRHSV